MRDALIAALYVVVLVAGVRSGLTLVLRRPQSEPPPDQAPASGDASPPGPRRRVPIATIVALLVIGVPTVLQLTVAPWLLTDLERDRAAILAGQVWRLVTSLVVQDGGVAGTVFNLVALAIVGAVAEQVWGTKRWIAIAVASGVVAQLWGLIVQPVGAGNSVAVFGLAASMAVAAFQNGQRAFAVACLVGSAALVVLGDIHGGAAVVGALMGWAIHRPTLRRGGDHRGERACG